MSKLTPNGQQVMNQILLDLQNYMGAAIQPHFDSLTPKLVLPEVLVNYKTAVIVKPVFVLL